MTHQLFAAQWLVRCALVATGLLLADRIATAWIGLNLQQLAATTRDGNLITLNRYLQEPTPDIVLVGSSLTWRLKEQYFSLPKVRNLALAGGSPITGLTIVANQRNLPKVIFIETNVLSRAVDLALVEKFSGSSGSTTLFLPPIRTAVAAYENWKHEPIRHAQTRAALEALLRQPPSDFDNRVYLDRALQQMNAEDPTNAVRRNVEKLKQIRDDISQRGSRVFLIEVPFSAPIEGSRSVRATRRIVHEAFPNPDQWLRIDPPVAELRWLDGVHLDERSALIVVQSIERALAGHVGDQIGDRDAK
jgi:hypothetical protein